MTESRAAGGKPDGWLKALAIYRDRRVLAIMFLGFSSGLPFLLVFSTMSLWLQAEGVSLAAIGLFSLVRTPYTFKFLWAPLIDRVSLPVLTGLLGRRRGWAILTQLALMASIFGLATTDPGENPWNTALFCLIVTFCSASQDVVIDAYRVEILEEHQQGAGAGVLVLGYRVGMLTAGAGALWLAAVFTWSQVYMIMAACVVVGIVTVLLSPEPKTDGGLAAEKAAADRISRHLDAGMRPWLARAIAWLYETVIAPFGDFMTRGEWWLILLFIMLYKLGDAFLGVMANPFYVEMGFSTVEIANISKVYGLLATVAGGILGGVLVSRFGIMKSLVVCGVLQMASNLVFVLQAVVGHDTAMLSVTITVENISGGMATAAFVAYLSSLCNVAYTATQYALLTSFMAFARDVLSASSGWFVEQLGWVDFFFFSTAAALPGLLVLLWLIRRSAPAQAASLKK